MALCTICLADPCPHLMMRGGTAGAPLVAVGVAAKYAPSTKPHCPLCDRVHRNIGIDNQPVCAWRTYSRAKGSDNEPFTPDNVDEFARWFRSGAWTAPTRAKKAPGKTGALPAPLTATVGSPVPAGGPPPPPTTPGGTVTIPVIEDDEPIVLGGADTIDDSVIDPTAPTGVIRAYTREEEDAAVARAERLRAEREAETGVVIPPPEPRKKPAFSKGKLIKDERVETPAGKVAGVR